jgi:hypothetical protein
VLIPFSLWWAILSIPHGGEKDDPLAVSVIIILLVIIYFFALFRISKIEKHSEV